ncbi:MAG: hypothetical protein R3244_11005 [Thermoanaerobaculia bacterium]|nr:hypothetical protein [Thermoanaerobaculia bacterium]
MKRFRIFGSHLTPGAKRVYRAVVVFYLAAGAACIWPLYGLFASARPLVLGLPLSLVWLVGLLLASLVVQLSLLRWESRRGTIEPPPIEPSSEDE